MTSPPPKAARRVLIGLAVIGLALVIVSNITDLTQKAIDGDSHDVRGELLFSDDFERKNLGQEWTSMHKGWKIVNGWVHSSKAHNRALWLSQNFSGDLIIEFDARSEPPKKGTFRGDIKCDAFAAEPKRAACGKDLCSTGYVIINGGWLNKIDLIARLDEHKSDSNIVKRRDTKSANSEVKPSTTYRWKIIRRGDTIRWYRDDVLQLSFEDDKPLAGGFFGFNNWESNVYFDNLKVYAAKP
jgi:hypothetical protein